MRSLLALILILLLAAGGAYVASGRSGAPSIRIATPAKFIGMSTPLEVAVGAPGGQLASLTITLEQAGRQVPLYSLGGQEARISHDGPDRLVVSRDVGRQSVPELQAGPARIVVSASRSVLFGLRTLRADASHDVQVRLERPRLSVLSTHHYVNLGGSEMIVYRATPDDVQSGVVVGDLEYPGYPASGVTVDGVTIGDPAVRVAFFALRFDQDLNTPMRLYARDEAGNTARAEFDHRAFWKPFKRGRIEIDDRLLDRVVPSILEATSEIDPQGDTLEKFLAINGTLRQKNAAAIASMARDTSGEMLWRGTAFYSFRNTSAESAFADHRTYVYKGREVDQQVHLGFDLASYAGTPIVAANRGKVLFADGLGIYGNCVIIDHGMGVQSLYAHLSSFDVKKGDLVEKEQRVGRSGMTGLAGGDHLHFTMLVNGHMVDPIEWWDPHWIEDRILRKLREAR